MILKFSNSDSVTIETFTLLLAYVYYTYRSIQSSQMAPFVSHLENRRPARKTCSNESTPVQEFRTIRKILFLRMLGLLLQCSVRFSPLLRAGKSKISGYLKNKHYWLHGFPNSMNWGLNQQTCKFYFRHDDTHTSWTFFFHAFHCGPQKRIQVS